MPTYTQVFKNYAPIKLKPMVNFKMFVNNLLHSNIYSNCIMNIVQMLIKTTHRKKKKTRFTGAHCRKLNEFLKNLWNFP